MIDGEGSSSSGPYGTISILNCQLVSAGLLVLENMPCEAVAEAAVAAALLLEHVPQAVSVLLRPGAVNSLVDAALEEVATPGSDATLGETLPCCLPCLSTVKV